MATATIASAKTRVILMRTGLPLNRLTKLKPKNPHTSTRKSTTSIRQGKGALRKQQRQGLFLNPGSLTLTKKMGRKLRQLATLKMNNICKKWARK